MLDEEFKAAVGKFPTGVTVISTSYDDNLWGFTANSFVSVSLSPALISFCLNKKSGSFEAFKNTENFAVNILASDQEDISRHFATRAENKFSNIRHKIGEVSKSPLIDGSACYIECTKYNEFDCGDHLIFIGEVLKVRANDTKSPLVYFAKSYQEINIKK